MDERRIVFGHTYNPKSLTETFQRVGRGIRDKTIKAERPMVVSYDVNQMYDHQINPDIMDKISKQAREHIDKMIEEQQEALIKGLGIKAEYFTRSVAPKTEPVDTSLITLNDIAW